MCKESELVMPTMAKPKLQLLFEQYPGEILHNVDHTSICRTSSSPNREYTV